MAQNMNTNATVNVAVRGLEQLNQLQTKLQQTASGFGKLQTAIAGVVTAGFIGNLYKMANDLTDMAAATGVSTQAILGFRDAVVANGGSVDAALTGLGKFVQTIGAAADGSKEAQDTFLKLGISLNDLRNLSEEDLLKKAIQGFNEGSNASERLSIAVALFGKTARSWDMSKINEQLAVYISKSKDAASANDLAGQASQNFTMAFKTLGTEILIALKPISELANAILESGKAIKIFIEWVVGIGSVILTFTALGKVISIIRAGIVAVGAGFTALTEIFAGTAGSAVTLGGVLSGLVKNIPILGSLAVGVAFIYGQVKKGIEELFPSLVADGNQRDQNTNSSKNQAGAIREVIDALGKEKLAIQAVVDAYKRSNEEANKKFKSDTAAISLSESQKLLQEELLSAETKYRSEILKLQDQINEKKISGSESDKALIPMLQAAQSKLTAEYEKQKKSIAALTAERVAATEQHQFELFSTKALIDSQNKLQAIQDSIAKSTMTELEKKYYDIDAAARASAKSAIEAEEARRNSKMPFEEQKRYYEEAAKGSEQLKALATEEYKNSRRFSTGWRQAFNEYVDNATNAATQAQRIFQAVTQGMEDLLMNFFKKGKWGWKDFVQSIIDVMMRSQIQQLVGKMMAPTVGGGGGGLLGGALIPGILAEGGPASMGTPYIVGERGPELFVPASNGTMIPNSGLGSQNVVYNINAVDAMSFKQMLAADPTFLHAVAEQGRRRIPGAR